MTYAQNDFCKNYSVKYNYKTLKTYKFYNFIKTNQQKTMYASIY